MTSDFNKWLLSERYQEYNANNVIAIDIQPFYARYMDFPPREWGQFLLNMLDRNREVLYFYNGYDSMGIDEDTDTLCRWLTEAVIEDHMAEIGSDDLDEYEEEYGNFYNKFHNQISWYDKGYGFFRSWMDQDVSERAIIRTIRIMAMKHETDSRELSDVELKNGLADEYDEKFVDDGIYLPHFSIAQLKRFSGAFLCGGGRNECLKEVQILMNAFNIKYTLMERFIF